MKIVILNECFFNEHQIDRLQRLGEVSIYSDTNTENIAIERLKEADIAIGDCFMVPFTERVFSSTPNLKFLTINSTGFELVNVTAASNFGIKVANVADFSTESVAEQTIGLMISVVRKIPEGDRAVRNGLYAIDPDNVTHRKLLGTTLAHKTLGIIGLGRIGLRVAKLAQAFGMETIAFNRTYKEVENVQLVALEELLRRSDIVSLHTAFSEDLFHLIGKDEISKMRDGVIIINTARGRLLDEQALCEALINRKIGCAGLDVLSEHPNSELLKLDSVVFSPHSAWYTDNSLKKMAEILVDNVESFLRGEYKNVVN